jgi:hypothetical protein
MSRPEIATAPVARTPVRPVAERSVPALVLELVDPSFAHWDAVGVHLGDAVEVGIPELARFSPELADRCNAYWAACRRFWDDVAAGAVRRDGVETRRVLAENRQTDSRQGRCDLTAELEAFSTGDLAGLVEQLTGTGVNWDEISSNPMVESVVRDGDASTVTLLYPGRGAWDDVLGGGCSRAETGRRFMLGLSHAKWRDRRVRRVVSLSVEAVEIWPNPAPFHLGA